jgi:general secretion pathway protein D
MSAEVFKLDEVGEFPEFADSVGPDDSGQTELKPVVRWGSGSFVQDDGRSVSRQESKGENFEAVDLREVIKIVFEEILNANYLIDPAVQGVVTINTTHAVSRDDVLPIFESILEINQAVLIQEDALYKIVPAANAKKSVRSPTVGDLTKSGLSGYGIQVVPLKYVSAKEMKKILIAITDNEDSVKVDESRNLVILSGQYRMIAHLQETVKMFDVDWLRGMSFGLFPLQHTEAKTLVDELKLVLGDDTNGPLAGIVKLIPIERLNAVMVVTHQPRYLAETKRLVEQFDIGMDKAPGRRLYVYRLKNGKAENIAEILQQVFGQQTVGEESSAAFGSTESRKLSNIRSPELSSIQVRQEKSKKSATKTEKIQSTADASTSASKAAVESEGESRYPVTIIGDNDNNAILVLASAQDYRKIQSTIKRLDVAPRQVLIEATIAEVELSDNLSYGVRWFLEGGTSSNPIEAGLGVPLPAGIGGEGFTLGIFNSMNELRMFFDIQIMVVDNQTATIRVGDQIPIITRSSQSTTSPDAPIVTEVQYRDTGTLLQVTPRINEGGMVTMEISQEVSRPGAEPAIGGGGNVPIAQRTIDSTVIVHSGQTIVLGGLIRETTISSNGGIPILKDIPFLGALFSTTNKALSKTELIVTLTPKVIMNPRQAFEVSRELRNKIKAAAEIEAEYRYPDSK